MLVVYILAFPPYLPPYRSFSLPSCILGQIEYECGSIDSQYGFHCVTLTILLANNISKSTWDVDYVAVVSIHSILARH